MLAVLQTVEIPRIGGAMSERSEYEPSFEGQLEQTHDMLAACEKENRALQAKLDTLEQSLTMEKELNAKWLAQSNQLQAKLDDKDSELGKQDAELIVLRANVRELQAKLAAEIERCATVALEQRCERGTPWDLACVTIAKAIRESKP
jgi:chromosome segregation ATPase